MEINTLNSTVLDRGILETQNDIATSQEMIQGGRRIQQQEAVVPAFQKMAITPGTSQRTILDHTATTATAGNASCATTETASDGEPESPEITVQPGDSEPIRGFTHMVDVVYHKLLESMETNWIGNPAALPFCLSVAKEIQFLLRRKEIDHIGYQQLVKNKIGPLYAHPLNQALQILQDQAVAGRSWEYHEEMFLLACCLEFYSTNENEADDKAMLAQVYQQFVDSELHYLDCMKNSFLRYPCDHSLHIIDTLLSDDSPACRLKILEGDYIAKSREKAAQIREHMSSLLARQEDIADKIQEEINELKEKIHHGTSDMTIKRTYHALLEQRIERVNQEWHKTTDNASDQQLVGFITELADCCEEQSMFLMEFPRLRNNLSSLLCNIGSHILVIIKDRPGNVAYLRDESMNIIHRLNETNWLNEECRNLYACCMQPKVTARTDKITDLECKQKFREITLLICQKNRKTSLKAACMLKQFLDKHENEINLLCTANSLNTIKDILINMLYVRLFREFFIEWDKCITNKLNYKEIDDRMSRHYSAVIDLIPYTQLLLKKQGIQFWKKIVCSIWSKQIQALSNKTSFSEDDVDILVNMNGIMSDVSNGYVRFHLVRALEQLFQFVLETDNSTEISVDKLTRLSEWSDHLLQRYRDKYQDHLRILTEIWKQKQWDAVSKRSMASSDTPEKTTPAPTHSCLHVANRFTEVPGGPFYARQQLVSSEMMQPSTTHGYIPAPAAPWPSQQTATVVYGSPATQSPIAAGPYPAPIWQFQPTHYGVPVPTPDDQSFCQQPATLVYGSPATQTQSPMAAGPYPAPIWQFQPTHYGMPVPTPDNQSFCQQPATLVYGSPATQSPMAAGPYPAPIQQFQPAPCGMLTGNQLSMPAMMSRFPVHSHIQVCPSCQFTACGPVQSQEQMATQQQYLFQPATSEHKPGHSRNL